MCFTPVSWVVGYVGGMKKGFFYLLCLLAGAALAQAQTGGAGANPVSYRLESYVVSQVTGDDGNQQETFTEATTARPGQVVEYRLFVENVGNTTLPPGIVFVTGPVPAGTSYVDDSATPTSEEVLTEFTADGQTYSEPPLIVAGTGGGQTAVTPTSYTAVRWTLKQPLEPGQEEPFVYRVTVQ